MNAVAIKEQLLDKIARLTAMNVPTEQIAQACGITKGRVSQLTATEEFNEVLLQYYNEDFEQQDTLNRGWDAVEEEALGTVLETLQHNPDPDFALRAATMANKAQRRGGVNGNQPINGNASASAVINLNQVFVDKLQHISVGREAIDANAKRIDALPIKDAELLLQKSPDKKITDIMKIFAE